MSRAAPVLYDFSRGEVSQKYQGRTDSPILFRGAKKLRNVVVIPSGGVTKMPGTYKVAATKTATSKCRLVCFVIDHDTAYDLELGNLYIRFYRNGTQIQSSGSAYEVASPYLEADLFELQFQVVGNSLYIVHDTYDPRKLTWTGDTSWALTTPVWTGQTFTGAGNRPTAVTVFEGRLVFLRKTKAFGSVTFAYEDFTVGVNPSDGWEFDLVSRYGSVAQWADAQDAIIIGTNDGEIVLSGGGQAITPTNVFARERTRYGSARIQGKLVGQAPIFVQRNRKTVREYIYSTEQAGYLANALNLHADHVLGAGAVEFAQQQNPETILWFVTADGQLVGLSYARELDVLAWHVHETDGEFESVSVIPGVTEDEIWVVVKRTINGSTVRYVERFAPRDWGSVHRDAYFVHCGITWDGGAPAAITGISAADPVVITCADHGLSNGVRVRILGCTRYSTGLNNKVFAVAGATTDTFTLRDQDNLGDVDGTVFTENPTGSYGTFEEVTRTVSGLSHLEGEQVAILADGATLSQRVVSAGTIAFDETWANTVHVGLPYSAIVEPNRLIASAWGGRMRSRVFRAAGRFFETVGAKVGPSESELSTVLFRDSSTPLGQAPPLFTGEKQVPVSGDYGEDVYLVFISDEPQPFTLLTVQPEMEVNAAE